MIELSVIVPTYQSRRLAETNVKALAAYLDTLGVSYEIILVDDASRPEERPRALKVEEWCRLLVLPQNLGKGGAVRAGLDAAKGKYLCFFDVDLPFYLRCFARALEAFREGAVMVAGDRRHPKSVQRNPVPWSRSVASQIFSWGAAAVLGERVSDTQCGFKGITAKAWQSLSGLSELAGFAFDLEWFAVARVNGWQVTRIPVVVREQKQSTVSLIKEWFPAIRDLYQVNAKRRAGAYRISQSTASSRLKKRRRSTR